MKIVLATSNKGKRAEFAGALESSGVELLSLPDFPGINLPEETGETFSDNAFLKARAVAKATGLPALADDSGLCVDTLGGAPGIRSARYAGENATDEENNRKLLTALEGVPFEWRSARFVCALALVFPEGGEHEFRGECEGKILGMPRGRGGFGYDPLFLDPVTGKTFAELTGSEKLARSHRGAAIRALEGWLAAGAFTLDK
ncbi:MAG: XTP/dITP diphosphatase [Bdellovibrionota bacterium]